ncbi:hypothetical protein PPYR_10111 [Photinus pyralis]|uniref:Uncharacterized protein n=1 Tax=Photinus pyralis TaxID=7054 RepID=A0A1Y1JXK7_PHOPY|nr:ras-like GTP-binding protein RhoL isoform X2 [Photinus pyralis]KAB0796050.1 hypothetical protein PPYR_10111 [Photinus pyralis]
MARCTNVTLVAVGDHDSKKTDLLLKYTTDKKLRDEFKPCIFTNNVQNVVVDRALYSVHFVNAESEDVFKSLRLKDYEKADCFLLCYSIKSRASFENVAKWCIEVRRCLRHVPLVLVGTESEGRRNAEDYVSKEEGEDLMYLIDAAGFVECSIKEYLRVDDVFKTAIRSVQKKRFPMFLK